MPQFQSLLANGDTLTISADSTQTSADGRSQYQFVSWSDGLARSHTITGSSAGASYVAQVSARYLTQFTLVGGGSVSATRTIDPAAGSFLAAGDSVTLTATAAAGQSFLGWTGDTTAGAAALKLVMTHPFMVTANFAATKDVVNQLLSGSPSITPAALALLDQLGNNNGRFDLGDLVAWLDRNPGLATSPVMLRLLQRISR